MRRNAFVAVLALLSVVAAPAIAGEKKKGRPDASHLPLWSAKGQPMIVRQYVHGLNAVLLLTDEQIVSLYAAWRETVDSPELREKGAALKTDQNATEEQRKELRLQYEVAQGRLHTRVAGILTPAQKELMASIEVMHAQAREAAYAELAPEFARIKANADEGPRVKKLMKERLEMTFIQRLAEHLTADQRAAMEKAAADEKRREAEAAKAPKK